jgi:hypothetical protein
VLDLPAKNDLAAVIKTNTLQTSLPISLPMDANVNCSFLLLLVCVTAAIAVEKVASPDVVPDNYSFINPAAESARFMMDSMSCTVLLTGVIVGEPSDFSRIVV